MPLLSSQKKLPMVLHMQSKLQNINTATQTATAAQMAFNTASKAKCIGAIASAVVGLGAALISYSNNADDAAREISEVRERNQEAL